MDEFQKRYLEHQERKKEMITEDTKIYNPEEYKFLKKVMERRRSQRVFNDVKVTDRDIDLLLEAIRVAPSSCNRQAVYAVISDDMEYISNTLVGAKGWSNNGNKAILIFADSRAYKSPNEKGFMPFLDAGFAAQNVYLMAEVLALGACYVNPNIREENKQAFIDKYGEDYFCGAFVIGHYDKKAKKPPLRESVKKR